MRRALRPLGHRIAVAALVACSAPPPQAVACGCPEARLNDPSAGLAQPEMIEAAMTRGIRILDRRISECLALMGRVHSEQRRQMMAARVAEWYAQRRELQAMLDALTTQRPGLGQQARAESR